MMNIFSSFNPINFIFFSGILGNFIITLNFWKHLEQKKFFKFINFIKNFIENDFNKVNYSMMYLNIIKILFIFNMFMNLLNLLPFSFCLNSQLNNFFFISLIFWFSCCFFSFAFFLNNFFSHLTPLGCPMVLSPLMVLIELISLLIRPITLSVRMSANMIAGHLLIHLLTDFSFFLMNLFFFSSVLTMFSLILLNLLEIGVAMVQPYIFCTLINMYLSENM